MRTDIKRIDVDMKELEQIVERARTGSLDEEDIRKLKAALETLGLLTELLGDKDTTINRLRQILFGSGTEKLSQVLGTAPAAADPDKRQPGMRRMLVRQQTAIKKRRNAKATAAMAPRITPGRRGSQSRMNP